MRSPWLLPCVAILASPLAAQAPVLGPPFAAPGDLTPGAAGGVQHEPDVAAGSLGSLAVWVDHRAEFTSPLANDGGPDVFAMRLDASGLPLDPVALRMPREVGDKSQAKAAWNGSAWLVTWENVQPLGTSPFFRLILGARVAADGTLLDAEPLVIKDDLTTVGGTTALASDGVGWVLTVQGHPSSPAGIVAVRIAPDGTVLNPGGTVITSLSVAQGLADLEHAAGTWLLVYGSSTARGLRFDDALAPLGGPFLIGAGSSSRARAATDGADFLVTWENASLGGRNVRARRVTGATGAQSPVLQLTPETNGDYNWEPDAAWTGALWTVVCTDTNADAFRLVRIAPDLSVLDPGGVALAVGPAVADSRARLAGVPGGTTVVLESTDLTQNWPGEIVAARVDDDLSTGIPVPLSLSATRQGFPSLAAGDGQYLAVFIGEQDDTIVIEAQRFDATGLALDAEPIELASGNRFGEPKVAFNGSSYLVVWEDRNVLGFETDDVVLGMRVGTDGAVLDPAPLPILDGGKPDVAAQGDTFLVVSSHAPSDRDLRFPFARRVAGDGTLLGTPVQLGGLFARYPRVAPLGDGWVVIWQRNFSHDNPNSVAHAALVALDGSASPDFLVDGAAGFGGASRPNVASAGTSALLVWQDDFTGLAGRRIDPDGTLYPPAAIAPLPALPSLPDVSWSGEDYLVAWTDYRALVGLFDRRGDVYAARVGAGGAPLDRGAGFRIAAGEETELAATAAGAAGTHLVGWTELLPDAPHATLRLVLRQVTSEPRGRRERAPDAPVPGGTTGAQ